MTTSTIAPAAALSDVELAVIEARLYVSGLFAAHAHTDMIRLLAEVHRLRALRAAGQSGREGESR